MVYLWKDKILLPYVCLHYHRALHQLQSISKVHGNPAYLYTNRTMRGVQLETQHNSICVLTARNLIKSKNTFKIVTFVQGYFRYISNSRHLMITQENCSISVHLTTQMSSGWMILSFNELEENKYVQCIYLIWLWYWSSIPLY